MSLYIATDDYQDRVAAVLRQHGGLGPAEADHLLTNLAGAVVDALAHADLLPTEQEYRRGHPDRFLKTAYKSPPQLREGEYLLSRLVTPWRGTAR